MPREQNLLEAYNHVILQFPLYWYSYPPLLKKWFDDVFAHGWAYGSKGDRLKGKKFGLAMSIGDKKENYRPEGPISFTVDELITPFIASTRHENLLNREFQATRPHEKWVTDITYLPFGQSFCISRRSTTCITMK
ncbi:NAD(P)H-dependent oxidoreductase [Paenibacillus tuaregi]|uniref:NAD(P)H-dependent oxidoreductase n=1 Tax=Paenibacillus tuaregi TaxID=1816681 RepID=UPI001F3D78B8|nr:NAD(P)H-dependent oxidoreductase [Paenibacillus tuaregi]